MDKFSYESKKVKAMCLISSIAERLDNDPNSVVAFNERNRQAISNADRPENLDLKGVISDKIHFEDFCYNHKNFVLEETIQLSRNYPLERQLTKAQVIQRLKNFMTIQENEACLLFLSGHGEPDHGNFILDTRPENLAEKPPGDEPEILSFKEMYAIWNSLNGGHTRKHLLMILDFCHSGFWVEALKDRDPNETEEINVSIQASCTKTETSSDALGLGGLFINNWLHINGYVDVPYNDMYKFDKEFSKLMGKPDETFYRQTPQQYGRHRRIWEIYRLRANFTGWKNMEDFRQAASEGTFISSNGEVYIGSFKSVQLQGYGQKLFPNGDRIEGFFKNNRLDTDSKVTEAQIKALVDLDDEQWNLKTDEERKKLGWVRLACGYECRGSFKDNSPYGAYRAKLFRGRPWYKGIEKRKPSPQDLETILDQISQKHGGKAWSKAEYNPDREEVTGENYNAELREGKAKFWSEDRKVYLGGFEGEFYHGQGLSYIQVKNGFQCYRGQFLRDNRHGIIETISYLQTPVEMKALEKKIADLRQSLIKDLEKIYSEFGNLKPLSMAVCLEEKGKQNGVMLMQTAAGSLVVNTQKNGDVDKKLPFTVYLSDGAIQFATMDESKKIRGKLKLASGDCYVGPMKGFRVKDGEGVVYTTKGLRLKCKFENDKADGSGDLLLRDGSALTGSLKAGEISFGLLRNPREEELHAQFVDGLPRTGKYICKRSGLTYDGQFLPGSFFTSPEGVVADSSNKDVMETILGIGRPKVSAFAKSQTMGTIGMESTEMRDGMLSMGDFPKHIESWRPKPSSGVDLPSAGKLAVSSLASQVSITPEVLDKKEAEAKPAAPKELPKPAPAAKPADKQVDPVFGIVGGDKWREGIPLFFRQGNFKILNEKNDLLAEAFMGNDELVC